MSGAGPGRRLRIRLVGLATVAAGGVILLAVVRWNPFAFRVSVDPRLATAVLSNLVVLFLFLGFVWNERRKQARARRRVARPARTDREEHYEVLSDFLRRTSRASDDAYRSALHARVRAYLRERARDPGIESSPVTFLQGDVSRTSHRGRAPVSGCYFVIVCPDAEPYWVRCNRAVEVLRYCNRVHPHGFELAEWDEPLPRRARFVDLIG